MQNRIRRPFQASQFTLIEMLVVLAIVVIIVGMTAGFIGSLKAGKGPEGASRVLSRMMLLSRQFAISENKRVALLLPRKAESSSFSDAELKKIVDALPTSECGSFMRPCIVDTSNQFQEFVKDTKWVFVPDRTVFEYSNSMETDALSQISSITGFSGSVPGIIYRPNGSTVRPASLSIDAKSLSNKSLGSGDFRTYYQVSLSWLTGKTQITKMKE